MIYLRGSQWSGRAEKGARAPTLIPRDQTSAWRLTRSSKPESWTLPFCANLGHPSFSISRAAWPNSARDRSIPTGTIRPFRASMTAGRSRSWTAAARSVPAEPVRSPGSTESGSSGLPRPNRPWAARWSGTMGWNRRTGNLALPRGRPRLVGHGSDHSHRSAPWRARAASGNYAPLSALHARMALPADCSQPLPVRPNRYVRPTRSGAARQATRVSKQRRGRAEAGGDAGRRAGRRGRGSKRHGQGAGAGRKMLD